MEKFLIVNFGGPRTLDEVAPFLTSLLTDRDVIRAPFPPFFHKWFFSRVARKRALKIQHDYEEIGGCSPIYFDTETLAKSLSERLQTPIATFHRYLPATHQDSIDALKQGGEIKVLPLFPQFSYATTGSIARFLAPYVGPRLRWIKSYATHPAFIRAHQQRIASFLEEKKLSPSETILLFSAHGVPKKFIDDGDPYQSECEATFRAVMAAFPETLGRLSYQSKFGRGEWIRPYTDETCEEILSWSQGRKQCLIIPISFTSDHIETLFEIEKLYLPIIASKGIDVYRCPALNQEPYWISALAEIMAQTHLSPNSELIRPG